MDIRQLRLFCQIVDRRSFSLAADEVHITQPAASQQIRSMERELKTTLLDRSRRTVSPTDAGQVLYRYAREMLDLHDRAITDILDLGRARRRQGRDRRVDGAGRPCAAGRADALQGAVSRGRRGAIRRRQRTRSSSTC